LPEEKKNAGKCRECEELRAEIAHLRAQIDELRDAELQALRSFRAAVEREQAYLAALSRQQGR